MSEDRLTHDDKRHTTLSLADKLDRVSIKSIKALSKKLEGCEPKP